MLTDHVQLCNSNRLSIAMYLICGINFISVTCLLLGVAIFINSSVVVDLNVYNRNERLQRYKHQWKEHMDRMDDTRIPKHI